MKLFVVSALLLSTSAYAEDKFVINSDGTIDIVSSSGDIIPVNPALKLQLEDDAQEGLKRKVTVCGQSMFLFYWQAPVCVTALGTTAAACAATAGGIGAPACVSGIGLSALSCSLSVAGTWGIIKHCIQ